MMVASSGAAAADVTCCWALYLLIAGQRTHLRRPARALRAVWPIRGKARQRQRLTRCCAAFKRQRGGSSRRLLSAVVGDGGPGELVPAGLAALVARWPERKDECYGHTSDRERHRSGPYGGHLA